MELSRTEVENRIATFRAKCAERGFALTPQRLAIYQALAGDLTHPTAEDLYRRVKPEVPSLSLGTVYRTLEMLEAEGLISRILAGDGQARFDANRDAHHHLICVKCRRVCDVDDPALTNLSISPDNLAGFLVLRHEVQLLGVCETCQANPS